MDIGNKLGGTMSSNQTEGNKLTVPIGKVEGYEMSILLVPENIYRMTLLWIMVPA